jgi:hypothetical protein
VLSEWAASAREKGEAEWVSKGDGWIMSVCALLGGVVGEVTYAEGCIGFRRVGLSSYQTNASDHG